MPVQVNDPDLRRTLQKLAAKKVAQEPGGSEVARLLANLKGTGQQLLSRAGQGAGQLSHLLRNYDYANKYRELMDNDVSRNAIIGALIGAPTLGGAALLSGEGTGGTIRDMVAGLLLGSVLGGGKAHLTNYLRNAQRGGEVAGDPNQVFSTDLRPGREGELVFRPGQAGVPAREVSLPYDALREHAGDLGLTVRPPSVYDTGNIFSSHDHLDRPDVLAGQIGGAATGFMSPTIKRIADASAEQALQRQNWYVPSLPRLVDNANLAFELPEGMDLRSNPIPMTGGSDLRHLAQLLRSADPKRLEEAAEAGFVDPARNRALIDAYLNQGGGLKSHLDDLGVDDFVPPQQATPTETVSETIRKQQDGWKQDDGGKKRIDQDITETTDKTKTTDARTAPDEFTADALKRKHYRETLNRSLNRDNIRRIYNARPSNNFSDSINSLIRNTMYHTGMDRASRAPSQFAEALPNLWRAGWKTRTGLGALGALAGGFGTSQLFPATTSEGLQQQVSDILNEKPRWYDNPYNWNQSLWRSTDPFAATQRKETLQEGLKGLAAKGNKYDEALQAISASKNKQPQK